MEAREIKESEFVGSPHRRLPDLLRAGNAIDFWRIPLLDSSTVAARLCPRGVPSPEARVVVLHGLGDDATYPLWTWLRALTDQGFETVTLDWDGHGASSESRLEFSRLGHSLERALDSITRAWRTIPTFLVGHSTGALAAALFREFALATDHPLNRTIRHYAFVSPALGLAPVLGRVRELAHLRDRAFLLKAIPSAISVYGLRGAWPAIGDFRRGDFPIRLLHPDRGSAAEQLARFTRGWRPQTGLHRGDGTSCLVFYGEKDAIVDLAAARERLPLLFQRVDYHPFPGQGHWGMAFSTEVPARLAESLAQIRTRDRRSHAP